MKVADVLMTEEFAQEMESEMEWRQDLQTRAIGKFGMIRRTPLDRLRERGVFKPELMVQMYGLVLQKRLGDFSRAEREYIVSIGKAAYIRTIERMRERRKGNECEGVL